MDPACWRALLESGHIVAFINSFDKDSLVLPMSLLVQRFYSLSLSLTLTLHATNFPAHMQTHKKQVLNVSRL